MADDKGCGECALEILCHGSSERELHSNGKELLHAELSFEEDISINGEIYITEHVADEDCLSWSEVGFGLLPLALPSAMNVALAFGLTVVPLGFIGFFLGDEFFSGASVGYFIISIFAQYPLCGLSFAMDGLCSQAYGRDPGCDEQGVILQRGILVGFAFTIPVCIILFLLQDLLPHIYGENTAAIASDFMKFSPFFIIPLVSFTSFSKFCLNQLQPNLPMVALVIGIIVTPLAQYCLVHRGVHGAMLGMAIVAWIQFFVIFALVMIVESTRKTLGKLRIREALEWDGFKEYLSLAIPSSLFVTAEASASDVAMLLSATLGPGEGAAFSAILNTLLMFLSISGGLSTAACARIGSSLGARLPRSAWRYAIAAAVSALILSSLNGVIIFLFFDHILGLFGMKEGTLTVSHSVRWMVPLTHIADSTQYVFQGVFSGMGRNKNGARILMTYLWLVGFPLELLFTYVFDWGIAGILGGLTIGLLFESPAMFSYLRKVNWDSLSREASDFGGNRLLECDPMGE